MLPIALAAALTITATTPKLAMTPLRGGDGTTPGMLKMLGEAVAAEIRRQKTFHVLTHDELKTVLSHEQLNQLIGCSDASCLANIGNAAGAQALATGNLGKVGESWLVTLKIIDVRTVTVMATADRRVRGGTIDDVLDQLAGMVSELVEGAAERARTAQSPPQAPATVSTSPTRHEIPLANADVPFTNGDTKTTDLEVITDGKGHFLLFDPKTRYKGPIFAGGADRVYVQRVLGGGTSGAGEWSATFWEPRVRARWQANLEVKDRKFALQCGDKSITYTPLHKSKAKRHKKSMKLSGVRWQRTAIHLARDDTGRYFLVDHALTPKHNDDYRLFMGTRGAIEYLPLNDAIIDSASSIFISDRGRFILRRKGRDLEAAWAVGDSEKRLTVMDLYQQRILVYTRLGAYTGQSLGTACDPHLAE